MTTYYVLLIGIDAYFTRPLHGCVNDIDAIQLRLMSPHCSLTPAHILRLASPHPGVWHDTSVPEKPATLKNIREALAFLASDRVAAHDRVFIYYSGHGARSPIAAGKRLFYREALVPIDFHTSGGELLYDFELNRALASIAARTRGLSLCLDCCHSAGATRDLDIGSDSRVRCLQIPSDLALNDVTPPPLIRESDEELDVRGVGGKTDDCLVLAACLEHELAMETSSESGVMHGLLTSSLLSALDADPSADLCELTWARVWQKMRAYIEKRSVAQHPRLIGNLGRALIGGPPVAEDPGYVVSRTGSNTYQIEAGTLANVTLGARIAVYTHEVRRFPPLASIEDLQARHGSLLRITQADLSISMAEAEEVPFDVPLGARGRLVCAGEAARLRCALVPRDDRLATSLARSPLLRVVELDRAEVWLVRGASGSWELTDDIHNAFVKTRVLYELSSDLAERARDVLEHYCRYILPVRMATQCTDLSGVLQVALLACPDHILDAVQSQQASDLFEAGRPGAFSYELVEGDRVCIRVRNTSTQRLMVTLLNSAASGKVQYLGAQVIDPQAQSVFWAGNDLGVAFSMRPPRNAAQGIDRIVAIGTTSLHTDLSHFRVDATFAEVVGESAGVDERATLLRDIDTERGVQPPSEQWTATQVIVRTSSPSSAFMNSGYSL
jgi:hypothetical protein